MHGLRDWYKKVHTNFRLPAVLPFAQAGSEMRCHVQDILSDRIDQKGNDLIDSIDRLSEIWEESDPIPVEILLRMKKCEDFSHEKFMDAELSEIELAQAFELTPVETETGRPRLVVWPRKLRNYEFVYGVVREKTQTPMFMGGTKPSSESIARLLRFVFSPVDLEDQLDSLQCKIDYDTEKFGPNSARLYLWVNAFWIVGQRVYKVTPFAKLTDSIITRLGK